MTKPSTSSNDNLVLFQPRPRDKPPEIAPPEPRISDDGETWRDAALLMDVDYHTLICWRIYHNSGRCKESMQVLFANWLAMVPDDTQST